MTFCVYLQLDLPEYDDLIAGTCSRAQDRVKFLISFMYIGWREWVMTGTMHGMNGIKFIQIHYGGRIYLLLLLQPVVYSDVIRT